jgi:hypothetical protein
MIIRGTTRVRCPACGSHHDSALVQTIDTAENPADKAKLLAGELNVLACSCGKRTQLAANILYSDKARGYFCQVVPGGEQAMEEAAAAFAASGVSGVRRLVPSQNALVEKVKLHDAGLQDWTIEMIKVLLLASIGELDRVLLFEEADDEVIRWVMFNEDGEAERVSSPRAQYAKLAERQAPANELRIDRAWAVEAVKAMVANAN